MTLHQRVDRLVATLAHGLSAVGVVCVVAMMVLTTADVVARYVFNSPTMWADEMASYLLIAIVFLGLAQNLRTDGHIRIDVITNLCRRAPRRVLEVFAYAVGILFSIMLIAGTWTRFDNFWMRHTLSDSPLMTPLWIAMVPVVIGAVVLGLAMVWGFVDQPACAAGRRDAASRARGTPDMAPILITLTVTLVLLLAPGVWVGVGLGLSGVLGLTQVLGWDRAIDIVGKVVWEQNTSFVLVAIPMFIFMGELLFQSGHHEHGLPAGGHRGDRHSRRAAAGQHRGLHDLRGLLGLERRLGRHHRLGRLSRDRQARLQQADRARLDRSRRHARHSHPAQHHLHRLRQPGRGLDRQAVPGRRGARPGALGALFALHRHPLPGRSVTGAAAKAASV